MSTKNILTFLFGTFVFYSTLPEAKAQFNLEATAESNRILDFWTAKKFTGNSCKALETIRQNGVKILSSVIASSICDAKKVAFKDLHNSKTFACFDAIDSAIADPTRNTYARLGDFPDCGQENMTRDANDIANDRFQVYEMEKDEESANMKSACKSTSPDPKKILVLTESNGYKSCKGPFKCEVPSNKKLGICGVFVESGDYEFDYHLSVELEAQGVKNCSQLDPYKNEPRLLVKAKSSGLTSLFSRGSTLMPCQDSSISREKAVRKANGGNTGSKK